MAVWAAMRPKSFGRVVPLPDDVAVLVELLAVDPDVAGVGVDGDHGLLGRVGHALVGGHQGVGQGVEQGVDADALVLGDLLQGVEEGEAVFHDPASFGLRACNGRRLGRRRGCGRSAARPRPSAGCGCRAPDQHGAGPFDLVVAKLERRVGPRLPRRSTAMPSSSAASSTPRWRRLAVDRRRRLHGDLGADDSAGTARGCAGSARCPGWRPRAGSGPSGTDVGMLVEQRREDRARRQTARVEPSRSDAARPVDQDADHVAAELDVPQLEPGGGERRARPGRACSRSIPSSTSSLDSRIANKSVGTLPTQVRPTPATARARRFRQV